MKWYEKYLKFYDRPFNGVLQSAKDQVRYKLSKIDSDSPVASVVIIAHNEETHLLSCLWSLVDNQCSYPIEIIVINNNSTDKTEQVLVDLGAVYYNEYRKGPGYARQCGLEHAKGRYYICIDADTIYPPCYIETHIKALMKPGVVGVFGLWSFTSKENDSMLMLCIYEGLRDVYLLLRAIKRPELCVRGMVFSFNTELGRRCNFRTDLLRGEDGSMALSLKPYGKLLFLTTRRARALTGTTTLNADGSLLNSFYVRFIKAIKVFGELFTERKKY